MKRSLHIAILMAVGILQSSVLSGQTLAQFFEIAAENNPGLQAEYKQFEAALTRVDQVNNLDDPTFGFGYFISPVETRVGPQRAKFSLSQMFPWFGTLKRSGDVAALNAEAKYHAFLDAKNLLHYEVAAAWYPLFELEKWLELETKNTEILRVYKTIATAKFENGEGSMVDVLRVDLMLKESETKKQILSEKKRPLLAKFNRLLNRDEFTEVALPDSYSSLAPLLNFENDSTYQKHPLVNQLDYLGEASTAQAALITKQGLPKIGVALDYVLVDKRNDLAPGVTVPDDGKNVLMPMVSVSIPLYRKKYNAAKREAHLMKESYALQKENLINRLTSDYETALYSVGEQKDLMDLYDRQITQSEQILNLLYSAYGNSGEDFEELLRVRQQLLNYEKLEATAMKEYQLAMAKIIYLTAKEI